MPQSSILIVTNAGRELLSKYMAGIGIFSIDWFAIGAGSVGLPPSPAQTTMDSLMQISGVDLTALTSKTFVTPSIANFQVVIPNLYVSPSPITELGLWISPTNAIGIGSVLFAYATFQGINKESGNDLTFNAKIQA